jgi:hypothetical protein
MHQEKNSQRQRAPERACRENTGRGDRLSSNVL